MAYLQLARLPGDAGDDLVVDRFVGKEPRTCSAALALVVEDSAGCSGDGEFQIGVGEHDGR